MTRINYASLWKVGLQNIFSNSWYLLTDSSGDRYNSLCVWQGLIFSDAKSIKEYSVKLGAGEDLYELFAGILTMKPWQRVIDPAVDHLVVKGTDSDRSELQVTACWILCSKFQIYFFCMEVFKVHVCIVCRCMLLSIFLKSPSFSGDYLVLSC